ncbi:hypothetical protein BGW39_001780 [Mortierella sp. 14UC]|nr:hypothetical protein BGW39_001780 [Mortierella sp. 14UC]
MWEGDIFVTQRVVNNQESDDADDDDDQVRVEVFAKASSSHLLRAIILNTMTSPLDSHVEANVYLQFPGSQDDDREVHLRKNCIRIYVDIHFPANLSRYESLKIQNHNRGGCQPAPGAIGPNTNAFVNDNHHALVNTTGGGAMEDFVVDQLEVRTNAGDIFVKDLVVSEELRLLSQRGNIMAEVVAEKRVVMEAKKYLILLLASSGPT